MARRSKSSSAKAACKPSLEHSYSHAGITSMRTRSGRGSLRVSGHNSRRESRRTSYRRQAAESSRVVESLSSEASVEAVYVQHGPPPMSPRPNANRSTSRNRLGRPESPVSGRTSMPSFPVWRKKSTSPGLPRSPDRTNTMVRDSAPVAPLPTEFEAKQERLSADPEIKQVLENLPVLWQRNKNHLWSEHDDDEMFRPNVSLKTLVHIANWCKRLRKRGKEIHSGSKSKSTKKRAGSSCFASKRRNSV